MVSELASWLSKNYGGLKKAARQWVRKRKQEQGWDYYFAKNSSLNMGGISGWKVNPEREVLSALQFQYSSK